MILINRLKEEEDYRRYPYRCTAGALTIGYGRNIDEDKGGGGICESEASLMLRNDLAAAEIHLKGVFPNWDQMGQVRRNAFMNMRFNLGPGGFLRFVNMLSAAKRGYWDVAGREARDSKWYFQVGHRAERISRELETGVSL